MVEAQSRRASLIPAEVPPADFTDTQYVDSRGCVFVRAGSNGEVTWFPRFGDDRQPVCGYEPSLRGGARLPGGQTARPEPVTPAVSEPAVGVASAPEPETQSGAATAAAAAAAAEAARAEAAAAGSEPGIEIVAAAAAQPEAPRATLTVRRQLGTVIEVAPPVARLTVIAQRGTIHDPDARAEPVAVALRQRPREVIIPVRAQLAAPILPRASSSSSVSLSLALAPEAEAAGDGTLQEKRDR